jgi:hypothetical protein
MFLALSPYLVSPDSKAMYSIDPGQFAACG